MSANDDPVQRFDVIRPVGRGGQGTVLLARDKRTGDLVSVKTVTGVTTNRPDGTLPTAITPHPRIACPRSHHVRGGDVVLVADWIEGTDLAQALIERVEPPDIDTVLSWLADAAEALWHLHTHVPPVVHGDVKPSNLVVQPDGSVVLIDLAGAGLGSAPTGTRGFQAPESVSGRTARSDVYGLAATATVLLGGRVGEGAPGLDRLSSTVEAAVRRVLARGLASDPARRQRSVHDLVNELRRAFGTAFGPGGGRSPPTPPFVGRGTELTAVEELLTEHRLVTLIGPGGGGKTRLAREAARLLQGGYGDGTTLVDLVPAGDRAQLIEALAAALGVTATTQARLLGVITDNLRRHSVLLVLDNCEHVVDAAAAVVADLLARCPRLSLLATSRQPLGLSQEVCLRVPPLAVPVEAQRGAGIARVESVRLFLDLVSPVASGLASDPRALETISRIVRRLDGLPLGIELAAARLGSTDLETLEAGLADAPRVSASASERHGSLDEAIEWSYDLLSPPQQATLESCSIFVGGWTTHAASAVAGIGEVRRVLAELTARSLIVQIASDRFTMLETVRAFASGRLERRGNTELMVSRHVGWIEQLSRRGGGPFTAPSNEWLDALDDERPNVRQAIGWVLAIDPTRALGLVTSLVPLWSERGRVSEGQRWISTCLKRAVAAPAEQRNWSRFWLGVLRSYDDVAASCDLLTGALEAFRATKDREGEVAAGLALAGPLLNAGHTERSKPLIEKALAHYRGTDDPHGFCRAGEHMVRWHLEMRDWDSAAALGEEMLPLLRELDRAPITCVLPGLMARAALYRGSPGEALRLAAEALEFARDKGGPGEVAFASMIVAEVHALAGDPGVSAMWATAAVEQSSRMGERVVFIAGGRILCAAAAVLGHAREAVVLNAALEAMHERVGMPFTAATPFDRWIEQRIRTPLDVSQLAAREAAGQQLKIDDVVDRLLTLGAELRRAGTREPAA